MHAAAVACRSRRRQRKLGECWWRDEAMTIVRAAAVDGMFLYVDLTCFYSRSAIYKSKENMNTRENKHNNIT